MKHSILLRVAAVAALVFSGACLAGEVVKMSVVASSITPTMAAGVGIADLAAKINEYSNGTIQAEAFYESQLGDTRSVVQGLQQGTVDIAVAGNAYFSALVPEIQVFEIPFLFDGYDMARRVVNSSAGDPIKQNLEKKGIKCLAFWEIGLRYLTNNVRPVKSMEDVKGLKLRTLPATVQVKTWENFGALPTAIDSNEIYSSLQTGVVVGQENSVGDIYTRKLPEVQKYMTYTRHVYTPACLGMSVRTWNKLDDQQKDAVLRAVADATTAAFAAADRTEAEWLAELDTQMEVEKNPDLTEFREVAKKSHAIFVDGKADRQALLDAILAER
ncbi:MAG: DctP family TRAP transporter solute-binding subunit [Planctomycetes bacterium]|nr:DctP family TRAP transporter solute-binding subunit [Planctomycetota bacterium]